MDENRTTAGQGLGIAGLVIGIIALLVAFIPCVGLFAVIPGVIAIIFSAIAFNQAKKGDGAKGIIIAALVISILATTVAALWGLVFSSLFDKGKDFKHQIERAFEEESGNSIDTAMKDFGNNMEKVLEDLETKVDSGKITIEINKKMSDTEFNQFIKNYEELINETIRLHKKTKSGDLKSVEAYSKVSLKLSQMITKLATSSPSLTHEQAKKLNELNKKYEKDLESLK
jgi:ascorbate-specific PTS system EIIC-type component UlaA